jgi:hypothetical protein
MSSFAKAPTCSGWLNSMPVKDVEADFVAPRTNTSGKVRSLAEQCLHTRSVALYEK